MDLDQATISSYVTMFLAPLISSIGISAGTNSAICGLITGGIVLGFQIWNEKHNSTVISGESVDDNEEVEFGAE